MTVMGLCCLSSLLFCIIALHFHWSFTTSSLFFKSYLMESHCLRFVITLVVLLSTSLLPGPVCGISPCNFPAVFNFGDSNSDTGGLSAAFGQAPPPNGESYFRGPAGRYSDGRLVVDFIAESLGLPYLSAFLDAVGSNFTHGANFATAGSTIRPQNTTLHQSGFSPFSLNVQFYQFNDFHHRSQNFRKQGGVFRGLLPKAEAFSRALYTFDIGQNDLTAGYFLNMSTDQVRAYIPDVLDQFQTIIRYIYDEGGRSFWIHNTGPVGCLPYIMDRLPITAGQIDKAGCANRFNEVAQYFNKRLKEAVVRLRMDLPLAAITYVDVYSVKYSLISQAKQYDSCIRCVLVAAMEESITTTRIWGVEERLECMAKKFWWGSHAKILQ